MKKIAIFLCLICIGYYGWKAFKGWLQVPQQSDQIDTAETKGEVFPSAMQHIVPIGDLSSFLDQERKLVAQRQVQKLLEQQKKEEIELKEKQTSETAPYPIPIIKPEQVEAEITSEQRSVCIKIGPILSKDLPLINRSIEAADLLETVRVESILRPDSYVVFIIPTTTQKGAQALLQQVKKRGYRTAFVVKDGPLLNAVQLGSFDSEVKADIFYKEALNKLKMEDIRQTRLIGLPSDKVNLIFSGINEQQVDKLKNLARKHGQDIENCGS